MKRVLFIFTCFILIAAPCFAELSVDDVRSREYIINHGYSEEMSDLIDLQYAQINNLPPKDVEEKSFYKGNNKLIKNTLNYTHKLFLYLDCGLDDGKFMRHDIKMAPQFDDL